MKRSDFRFFHRLRVRWAEIDMQKIVFNGHYLTYIDTAVTAYWGRVALPYETAFHLLGGELYVKKATLEYHASAVMDDDLSVGMKCSRLGNSSMVFEAGIFRAGTTSGLAAQVSVKVLDSLLAETEYTLVDNFWSKYGSKYVGSTSMDIIHKDDIMEYISKEGRP